MHIKLVWIVWGSSDGQVIAPGRIMASLPVSAGMVPSDPGSAVNEAPPPVWK